MYILLHITFSHRDGSNEMIESLHRHGVPLLVFSAGIGDILMEAIKLQATFYEDNMYVVSNCMEFNEEVKCSIILKLFHFPSPGNVKLIVRSRFILFIVGCCGSSKCNIEV